MSAYQNTGASDYDFDMFETHARASAAPARKPEHKPAKAATQLKLVENKKPPVAAGDMTHTGLRSIVILLFAAAVLAVIGLQINAGARSYELSQQIEQLEKKISEAETENIRLTNALNSITTIENIDTYAREVLGMAKCEAYQIKCIDLSGDDKVLYSGGSLCVFDIFNKNK